MTFAASSVKILSIRPYGSKIECEEKMGIKTKNSDCIMYVILNDYHNALDINCTIK